MPVPKIKKAGTNWLRPQKMAQQQLTLPAGQGK